MKMSASVFEVGFSTYPMNVLGVLQRSAIDKLLRRSRSRQDVSVDPVLNNRPVLPRVVHRRPCHDDFVRISCAKPALG